ncbi:hypothetical protein [Affinirhizobium pseudoryzae]|uniref:hypothetical protein n=1 Tax=Allorhizobium pseudoryzae TaxID=379684 RepID=UPI0013EE0E18|nr:hypothetical protein [Allorhizobium pseudoryzae]
MDSNTPKALAEASPGLQALQWKYDFNNIAFDALEEKLQDLRKQHLPAFQAEHGKGNYAQALFEELPEVRQIRRAMAQRDRNALKYRLEFYGHPVKSPADGLLKFEDAKLWLFTPEASEYADEMAEWLRSLAPFFREQSFQAKTDVPSAGETSTLGLSETIATFRATWERAMAEDLHRVEPDMTEVRPWTSQLEALKAWNSPAANMADALEALRLVRDEAKDFEESPLIFSLVSAALGFLEKVPVGDDADVVKLDASETLNIDRDRIYDGVREAQAMVRLARQALRQIAVMPLATPFADFHQDISDIARTTEAAARCLDTALSRIDLVDAQGRGEGLSARDAGTTDLDASADVGSATLSLTQAIADYHRGMAAYEAAHFDGEPPEGFDQETYGCPMDVLSEWKGAAVSVPESLLALEVVVRELDGFACASPLVKPLVCSALTFFRKQELEAAPVSKSAERIGQAADLDAVYEVVREAQAMVRLAHQALRQITVMPLATPFADCHQVISDIARTTEAAARCLDTALSRIDLVDAQASASA